MHKPFLVLLALFIISFPIRAEEIYICPMHPQISQHEPGACPICNMALVQKIQSPPSDHSAHQQSVPAPTHAPPTSHAHQAPSQHGTGINVSDAMAKAMDLRTSKIGKQPLRRTIKASGYIRHAGGAMQEQHLHTPSDALPNTMNHTDRAQVLADVFYEDIKTVRVGDKATIYSAAISRYVLSGVVEQVLPAPDKRINRFQVMISCDTQGATFKPDARVSVEIFGETVRVLGIPFNALFPVVDGEQVMKRMADGKYAAVAVKTGMRAGNFMEVLGGLSEGDEIVVSGQFLLDAESKLQASLFDPGME